MILTLDSTDDFGEDMEGQNCLVVENYTNDLEEAKKMFEEVKGSISNSYLVQVLDQEEYI